MRLFARGIAALALAACALGGAGEVPGQGAKVRLGVLKLTSSAVLFLGAEKGYFREFGVEPELVFFDAAQPIAVAIASRSEERRVGKECRSRWSRQHENREAG